MEKTNMGVSEFLLATPLDRTRSNPLHIQLRDALRRAIRRRAYSILVVSPDWLQ
jgi:hypothetical protein